MIRPLLVLAALLLALAVADAWLARRAERVHAPPGRVGPLFTREEAEHLRTQPALRIEGAGESHSYGRIEGRWRCLSYHEAPADARAIQELLDGLAGAEGIVHARGTEAAPTYGINTPRTLRVSIQGPRATQDPSGDVQATLELGSSSASGGFVRRKGRPEIWSIAGDLRAALERRIGPELPPLLAASAVPSEWLASGGLVAITLKHGAEETVIERRDVPPDPSAGPGVLPWRWILDPGPDERVLTPEVGEGLAAFLEALPYRAVEPATARDAAGLAPPRARITLRSRSGPTLLLAFGASNARGEVALWVEASATLYRVSARTFELALPSREVLTAEYPEGDPWSTALREP
jgi:hypothetical protein